MINFIIRYESWMHRNNFFPLIKIFKHTDLNNNFLKFFVKQTKIKIPIIMIYRYKINLKNYMIPYTILFNFQNTAYRKNIKNIIIWNFSSIYISSYKTFEILDLDAILFDDKYFIKSQIDIELKIVLQKKSFFLYYFIKKVKNIMYLLIIMDSVSKNQKFLLILCDKIIKSLYDMPINYLQSKISIVLEQLLSFLLKIEINRLFYN